MFIANSQAVTLHHRIDQRQHLVIMQFLFSCLEKVTKTIAHMPPFRFTPFLEFLCRLNETWYNSRSHIRYGQFHLSNCARLFFFRTSTNTNKRLISDNIDTSAATICALSDYRISSAFCSNNMSRSSRIFSYLTFTTFIRSDFSGLIRCIYLDCGCHGVWIQLKFLLLKIDSFSISSLALFSAIIPLFSA